MVQNPLAGIFPRGHSITATDLAREEMHKMPQAVTWLSLEGASELSPEEMVVSRHIAPMLETYQTKTIEIEKEVNKRLKNKNRKRSSLSHTR